MSFPLVQWSKEYEQQVLDALEERGLSYQRNSGSDGAEFIDVDFGEKVLVAADFARYIFLSIFGVPKTDSCFVYLDGARV